MTCFDNQARLSTLTKQLSNCFATWLSISYKNFPAFLSQSGYMFSMSLVILTFQSQYWKSLSAFLAFQRPSFWDCKGANLFLLLQILFFIFYLPFSPPFPSFLSLFCGLQRCNFLSSLSSTFFTYFSGRIPVAISQITIPLSLKRAAKIRRFLVSPNYSQ